jgi:hypothetical protein
LDYGEGLVARSTTPSLAGGEVSSAIGARVDIDKYKSSVKIAENVFVKVHGGLSSRPGFKFVAEVKNSSLSTRIIPFEYNTEQTYILEFGNLYMRVHKDGGQVLDTSSTGTVSAATKANPCVITDTSHGYADGDEIFISGVVGMTELNNRNFLVASKTTHTYQITNLAGTAINSTAYTTLSGSGTSSEVFEIVTPYTTAQLFDVGFVQSADVMTLCHTSHAPRELIRTAHDTWTLSTISFAPEQAAPTSPTAVPRSAASETESYAITAVNLETLEESLVVAITITNANATVDTDVGWAAATGAGSYNIYRKKNGIYGFIGRAEGLTFFDDNIAPDTADTPPAARNPFDATSDYPAVVGYFQQRRIFGRSINNKQRLWFSQTANHYNMSVSSPAKDDDAITGTIAALKVNEIRHMIPFEDLVVLTSGGEWRISGVDGVITPSTIQLKPQTYYGSTILPPIVAGDVIIYMQPGQIVRDLAYEFTSDLYKGNDISVLARHMFDFNVMDDWSYAPSPHSLIWVVRDDGDVNTMTYIKEQEVFGWTRQVTQGKFKSIASVRESDDDFTYAVIERTINGATVQYIERQNTHDITDIQDAFYVDAGLSLDTPITITGFTNANPIVVTAPSHGLSNADTIDITGLVVLDTTVTHGFSDDTEIEGLGYTVASKTTHTFQLQLNGANVNGAAFKVYHSGGEVRKAVTSVGGLWHLEGEPVSVLANGYVVSGKTVTNGVISLNATDPASRIHVGLGYLAEIETLRLDAGSVQPSSAGLKKKLTTLTLDVENTMGLWVGPDRTHMRELKFGLPALYGQVLPMVTGLLNTKMSPKWSKEGRVVIQQRDPLPMSILSITPEVLMGAT